MGFTWFQKSIWKNPCSPHRLTCPSTAGQWRVAVVVSAARGDGRERGEGTAKGARVSVRLRAVVAEELEHARSHLLGRRQRELARSPARTFFHWLAESIVARRRQQPVFGAVVTALSALVTPLAEGARRQLAVHALLGKEHGDFFFGCPVAVVDCSHGKFAQANPKPSTQKVLFAFPANLALPCLAWVLPAGA